MRVSLISWTKDPIKTIAEAASICYDSEPSLKIVKGCIKSNHLSVTEHCNFTFKIEGVSRVLTHQLVRHRIASYSQRSQRYCLENKKEDYIMPKSIDEKFGDEYEDTMNFLIKKYNRFVNNEIPKEDARMVLPNACPTSIIVTMNLRSLAHFMNERLCARSQWEIRELANKMKLAVLTCPEIDENEREIVEMLLIPKCMTTSIPYCPEHNGCGRFKSLKKLFEEKDEAIEKLKNEKMALENIANAYADAFDVVDDVNFNISD